MPAFGYALLEESDMEEIRGQVKEDKVELFVSGRIDSTNAAAAGEEFDRILEGVTPSRILSISSPAAAAFVESIRPAIHSSTLSSVTCPRISSMTNSSNRA